MRLEDNPALAAFLPELTPEKVWGQVLISALPANSGTSGGAGGYSLRHVDDRGLSAGELRSLRSADLRRIATTNAAGQFRPLKAAPDLSRGWILNCADAEELWRALQEIYPGSIPDWFACQSGPPPFTDYRTFTCRQSGMYRITRLLDDDQAAMVLRAACAPSLCLKRRYWGVRGAEPDSPPGKSEIPCLEPCALLLELARKASRIEQEEKLALEITPSDLAAFIAAAESALQAAQPDRAGNIASPLNPRRLQLLLEKFRGKVEREALAENGE